MSSTLLFLGCPKPARDPEKRAAELLYRADRKLAAGRLHEARQAYDEALELLPGHPGAALGSAVTNTLLLPDSKPIADLLDLCRLPRFDVEYNLFGEDGPLAQLARSREGSGELKVYYRGKPGEAFAATHFTIRSFLAAREGARLVVELQDDLPYEEGTEVILVINPDDVYGGDAIEPLTRGMSIDVQRMEGYVAVRHGEQTSQLPLGGSIRFEQGTQPGERLELHFEDVALGACDYSIPSNSCDGEFRLSGTIQDVLTSELRPPQTSWPLSAVSPFEGPPFMANYFVALQQCGEALTTELLTVKASQLVEVLSVILARLDVALAQGPERVSFIIPGALLHVGSSRVDLQACKLEYSIVSPK